MSNLVQRLRYGVVCPVSGVTGDLAKDMTEAADRIEQLERCLLQAQNAAIALERSNKELREALNQFDNPYLVGNVWKWFGPTPEVIDAALSAADANKGKENGPD